MYQLYIINYDIDKTSETMKNKFCTQHSSSEESSENATSFLGKRVLSSLERKNNSDKKIICHCSILPCECKGIYH